MINIGICDDEMGIRIFLDCVVSDYFMQKGLLFEVKKYATGAAMLQSGDQLDLLFLDITMPGLNGIETGKKLREANNDLKIIYITAHEHYALEAFKVKAFQYLIKPVEQDKLYKVLDDVIAQIGVENNRAELKYKFMTISANEISHIEAQNHQYSIHTIKKDKKNIIKDSLKKIEPLLKQFKFERIRRGLWINPIHVESRNDEKIYMINEEIIQVIK